MRHSVCRLLIKSRDEIVYLRILLSSLFQKLLGCMPVMSSVSGKRKKEEREGCDSRELNEELSLKSSVERRTDCARNTFLSSPHLCFIIVFISDLFVSRDDPLMS